MITSNVGPFNMKKAIPILLLTILVTFFVSKSTSHSDAYTRLHTIGVQRAQLGHNTFHLFIADTEVERTNGLSNIKDMASDEGVAFIFKNSGQKVFWMKDMLFPLDFVYIHNNRVVELKENILPSSYPNTIVNQQPANIVIELSAGQIKQKNIQLNDILELDSN